MVARGSVVIVGAGIAGLSAAQYLQQSGFTDVTVLEASHRIGGRMRTEKFGFGEDSIVELGANWIHGAAATNSVIVLANQHSLLEGSVLLNRMEGTFYRSDGRAIGPELTARLWKAFNRWFEEARDAVNPDTHISWGAFIRQRFSQLLANTPASEQEDMECAFNCLLNLANFKFAGALQTAFAEGRNTGKGSGIPGGNVKVPKGMRAIIGALSYDLPSKSVLLEQTVISIQWQDSKIRVQTDNGNTFTTDHVIVTVPLGYLKKHHSNMFQPPLPTPKVDAIDTIPFGKVNKIFLHWEKPFWTKGSGSIKLAWTSDHAQINSELEWYKSIFAFDEVLNNPTVLVAWLAGAGAEYVESLPEKQVLTTCTHLIRKFLRNPSIPGASNILVSRWCTDPLYQGSYTYVSEAMSRNPGSIQSLGEPLLVGGVPRVLFAGSATISWAYSTMHGGRSSGLREGERLALFYGTTHKSFL